MPFAAALSEHPIPAEAAGEALGQILEVVTPEPDLAVLFATTPMTGALEDVVGHCGVTLERAIAAASTNPAGLLGLADRGTIETGRRADLVALDPDTLRATETWIQGTQVHG